MTDIKGLITDNIDIWTSAIKKRNATGRGSNKKIELTGVKKLRELILELAVRGKLVPQDANDEPASVLLERIAAEKAQLIVEKKIKKQKPLPVVTEEDKPFELPVGWSLERFGNIYLMEYGDNLSKPKRTETGEYNVYGSNGVVGSHKQSSVQRPCIVIGRKGSAGALNLCKELGCWVTDVAYSVIPPIGIDLDFAFKKFHTLGFDKLGKGIKPGLNRNEANIVVVAIPPIAEQHRIVAKVDELMTLCDQLEQQTEQSLTAHQTLVEELLNALFKSSDSTSATTAGSASDHTAKFQESWARIADHFDILFTTEPSIEQLKQTILQLAVMGKLVPQNPADEPASVLLEKIAEEKAQLIADKKIKKQKPLPPITDEEKQFKIPNTWHWTKLNDVSVLKGGFAFKSTLFVDDSKHQVIRMGNIRPNKFRLNEKTVFINEVLALNTQEYKILSGDILLTMTGTKGKRDYLYSLIVNDEDLADKELYLNQRLCISRAILVDSKFVNLFLKDDRLLDVVYAKSTGTANQANIGIEAIQNWVLPLPPLAEQHRIVAKVDELMALCDQLKARLNDAQTTQLQLADAVVEQTLAIAK